MLLWDWITFLWDSAKDFLSQRIDLMGLHFTLWEYAFGSTILVIVFSAIMPRED